MPVKYGDQRESPALTWRKISKGNGK